ncbi:MAG: dTDP-4-dehydrorhamnose reductase [Actinomycetota bacterium]|jgi:dTDP-4-dehydrorhamnose reductase
MRFLITGAGGQLGTELARALTVDGRDVIAADVERLDVGDRDAVLGAVTSLTPDVIINAAAWTDVDGCEADVDRAFRANALAVRYLADGARRIGAHLVQVSTDYVFDGTATRPYVEWDAPNPQSVYGRSKRGGELELDPASTIVRTSGVFSPHGHNIVKTIVGLATGGDGPLRFVDDQRTCVTSAADLADVLVRLAIDRAPGTFHVTNQGETSWYELARTVVGFAGEDPARVAPISTVALGRPAPRPANAVLDNAALRASGMPLLPDHREPLERLVKELIDT